MWGSVDELVFDEGSPSAPAADRRNLLELLQRIGPGDDLTAELPYLGCTASDILNTIKAFEARGVTLRFGVTLYSSDRESSMGSAMRRTVEQLAKLEEQVGQAREVAVAKRQSATGVRPGRPRAGPLRSEDAQLDVAMRLRAGESLASIAAVYGVHRRSVERLVAAQAASSKPRPLPLPRRVQEAQAAQRARDAASADAGPEEREP